MANAIQKLSQANRMLVEASTLEDIQEIRGIALMAQEYAKAANSIVRERRFKKDWQKPKQEITLRQMIDAIITFFDHE